MRVGIYLTLAATLVLGVGCKEPSRKSVSKEEGAGDLSLGGLVPRRIGCCRRNRTIARANLASPGVDFMALENEDHEVDAPRIVGTKWT